MRCAAITFCRDAALSAVRCAALGALALVTRLCAAALVASAFFFSATIMVLKVSKRSVGRMNLLCLNTSSNSLMVALSSGVAFEYCVCRPLIPSTRSSTDLVALLTATSLSSDVRIKSSSFGSDSLTRCTYGLTALENFDGMSFTTVAKFAMYVIGFSPTVLA